MIKIIFVSLISLIEFRKGQSADNLIESASYELRPMNGDVLHARRKIKLNSLLF